MKKTRFIVCTILVLLMLIPFGMANVSAADTVSTWDGTRDSSWYVAGATELVINDAADLAAFAYQVRNGTQFIGVTVKLNCNIVWASGDASEWSATNKPSRVWSPIGTGETNSFRGTFDGQGHYVSGLYCKTTGSTRAGFFGEICNATVKNLAVINSYFCADQIAGGIAGMARFSNTISGCYVDAYIHNVTSSGQIGGLIGQAFNGYANNSLTISNCETRGVITSDLSQQVGGMVGIAKGSPKDKNGNASLTSLTLNMTNCISTATLSGISQVGGMVGKADCSNATFNTCYYKGDIYVWSTANIGGVVGGFGGDATNKNFTLYVNKCYYDGNFYRGSGTSLGGLYAAPTRVGGVFGATGTYGDTTYQSALYGAVNSSSTYYTDSTDDNSDERSGSMSVFGTHTSTSTTNYTYLKPKAIASKGGLSAWLNVATSFTTDIYGNVRLKTLPTMTHDCADHYGKWIDNGEGQKRGCTYGSCVATETRDASFAIVSASIRYDDPSGIRFLTKVDKNAFFKDIYTGNDNSYAYSGANITFGTVVLPKDLLDGELTVDTPNAVNITAKKIFNTGNYVQTADTFYYSAVIVNLPEQIDTYNRDLAVRSYAKYTVNGETVYLYTDTAVTSFYNVAEMAYADANTTASVKEGLNMTLALGAVSDEFYSKDFDKVQILENASVDLFNEYAASLASQGFTKHTNYSASGNYFALYYNNDYVVTFYYTPKTIANYVEPDQEWYAYGSKVTEDMAAIENTHGVTVDTATNIMRVIVEKRSQVDLPGTAAENEYERNNSITNSIGEIFPNNNYSHYGMGYIVQLADGSFIIIDGGENEDDPRNTSTDTDSDLLYQYMMSKKPDNHEKPIIAAWILTHRHNDHVEVFQGFGAEYKDLVDIEQVIYNFSSGVVAAPTEERKAQRFADDYIGKYYPDVKIVTAHTGYKFYIRNAEITILYSIDDLAPTDLTQVFTNNESIVFDMVIDGKQRIMFTGEVFIPGSYALINMYGADLKSDVIQLSHHGHYGAIEALYKLIWPAGQDYTADDKFVLWPIGNEEQRRDRLPLAENKYITNRLQQQGITNYMSKIHSAVDIMFENGATDVVDKNATESDALKAIGKWHSFDLYTQEPDYDTMKPWPWSN